MNRRRYLAFSAVAATSALAGCNAILEPKETTPDEATTERNTDSGDGGDPPYWTSWIPAPKLEDAVEVTSVDVQSALEASSTDSGFRKTLVQMADFYGISRSSMASFSVVRTTEGDVEILTGNFDATNIRSQFRISNSKSYRGYQFIESSGDEVVIDDSALVSAPSVREYIDARTGYRVSLGNHDDWARLLSVIGDGMVVKLSTGNLIVTVTPVSENVISGVSIEPAGEGARGTVHIQFPSSERAQKVYQENRDTWLENDGRTGEQTVDLERESRRIVLTFEREEYELDY
ncbi:hypothetical protein ACOZ4N_18680 [Halorientalis pallida]|uniref:hypothetical protein n=1 Tax=Halorientalis pallida TaxID=2479928 RepID=UPI003C6F2C61